MKLLSFLLVALLVATVCACDYSDTYESKAFKDDVFALTLVAADDGYRFQVCKDEQKDEQCVNPFYFRGGAEEAVFADIPDVSDLHVRGKALAVSRRVLESVSLVVIAAATMVVVPAAAYQALKAVLSIGKKGAKGVKTIYENTVVEMSAEAQMKAIAKGKPTPTLKDTEKSLKFLQSKFVKFLAAFISVQAIVGSVEYGFSGIKSIFSYMRDNQWGEAELVIARNFSHMKLASDLPVSDVKKVLTVLRKHLNLVFSDEYLELTAAES